VRCKDGTIGKVLVDNNLALNVLPKHVLNDMSIDSMLMLPNTIIVRAYDGSPRQMVGTIEMELFISLQVLLVTLQVMDIHPSYSMLLGRPWTDTTSTMTSS
jgi:hypothetical protein